MAAKAVRGKKPSEREQLRSRVAKALGISEDEAETQERDHSVVRS